MMKPNKRIPWSLFASIACMGGVAGARAWAESTDAPLPPIHRAAPPIVIDGVLDDAAWADATPVEVHYIWGGAKGRVSEAPRMRAWYTWDARYLYLAYETFDTNLAAKGSGEFSGPAGNQRESCLIADPDLPVDVVEFFIGFDDPHVFWEIHHSAADQFSDILVFANLPGWQRERPAMAASRVYWAAREFIRDDGDCTLATAVQLKPRADGGPSTVNDDRDLDAGYIAELRLPWAGIGAPVSARGRDGWAMQGREIAILAVVQNGDLEDRYHTSSATLQGNDFFHNNVAHWPRYELADGPE